jgi:hypothetical protein
MIITHILPPKADSQRIYYRSKNGVKVDQVPIWRGQKFNTNNVAFNKANITTNNVAFNKANIPTQIHFPSTRPTYQHFSLSPPIHINPYHPQNFGNMEPIHPCHSSLLHKRGSHIMGCQTPFTPGYSALPRVSLAFTPDITMHMTT